MNRIPSTLVAALVLLAAGCSGSRNVTSELRPDVVAVVGGRPIPLSEFERQYLRTTIDSAAAASDSIGAYRDFLDRYVDFRLKVLEAERVGYGDLPELRSELDQYKVQLARPYLLEREVVEPLIRELYERRQEMVDASHVLIRVGESASAADTARAWKKIAAIADSIRGGADFDEMARRHSEDPSARGPAGTPGSGGRLGFFSAGRMVKPFEDAMYRTPVGELSEITRTQFGYHLLFVHDRRPTVPDLRISHIMIRSATPSPEDTLDAFSRLEATTNRLALGTPFEDVARDLSDDDQSAGRGGDLDFVSYDGWLPPEMRDAAFAVDSVGAVVGPVRTRFGWHLMKITDRRGPSSLEDSYGDLQAEVARLPRSQAAERAYARRLLRARGSTIDSSLVAMLFGTRSPDSLLGELAGRRLPTELSERAIATVGDSVYTLGRFGAFIPQTGVQATSGTDRFWKAVDAFLEDRALAHEIEALAVRDEEFAGTMSEFREGLMLFRLMEDSVWTAATEDSIGLRSWYDAHAADYRFGERTRVIGFYSRADSVLREIAARLDAGAPLAELAAEAAADTTGSVRIDTTMVEGQTDSVFDRALLLERGKNTGVVSFGGGRVVLVNDGTEPPRPKTFEEARAEVANAWQDRLEERLVSRLREAFGASIHPEVLVRAFGRASHPGG